MAEAEILTQLLGQVARRLRLNRALQAAAVLGGCLCGAAAVQQILRAVRAPDAVNVSLGWLLLIAIALAAAWFVWRVTHRATLAEAAGVADRRGELKDALKTAYWFLPQTRRTPLIDLQLARAGTIARELRAAALVPLIVPRGAVAVLLLALTVAIVTWVSPRLGYSRSPTLAAGKEGMKASQAVPEAYAATMHGDLNKAEDKARESAAGEPRRGERPAQAGPAAGEREARGARENTQEGEWAKLEQALRSSSGNEEGAAIAAAVKARDAARAAQLLGELEHKRAFARANAAALVHGGEAPAETKTDLVSALQAMFNEKNTDTLASGDEDSGSLLHDAVKAAQKLEQRPGQSEPRDSAGSSRNEAQSNPVEGAIPLTRSGPRQTSRGEGEGDAFNASTNVEGGAMGRHVTQTTAGEGGNPEGEARSDVLAAPVLGERTTRLDAQLRRIKIDSRQDGGSEGIIDRFYAATQSQQSALDYQAVAAKARYTKEHATSGERVPLAYRGVVKEYFLELRRNEK
jgi:hypothetical protein